MESKISLTVPGEPQGKQRARWSPHGTHTPQKTINYETYIKELFANKYRDFLPLESPLIMNLWIGLLIPKSTSKKKKMLMDEDFIRPIKRPDIDNIIKVVFDALQGLAFKNDSQFIQVLASKYYTEKPRLEIVIYEQN